MWHAAPRATVECPPKCGVMPSQSRAARRAHPRQLGRRVAKAKEEMKLNSFMYPKLSLWPHPKLLQTPATGAGWTQGSRGSHVRPRQDPMPAMTPSCREMSSALYIYIQLQQSSLCNEKLAVGMRMSPGWSRCPPRVSPSPAPLHPPQTVPERPSCHEQRQCLAPCA